MKSKYFNSISYYNPYPTNDVDLRIDGNSGRNSNSLKSLTQSISSKSVSHLTDKTKTIKTPFYQSKKVLENKSNADLKDVENMEDLAKMY